MPKPSPRKTQTATLPEPKASSVWFVYILRTRRDFLYTGIATDVDRRLGEHEGGSPKGARSLRGQAPLALVYRAKVGTRSDALRIEASIKKLPKLRKEELVAQAPRPKQLRKLLAIDALGG